MNLRKNILLIVGGGICAVMLVVSVVFLVKYRGRFVMEQAELTSAEARLASLRRADPYPSAENVEAMTRKRDELRSRFGHLVGVLRGAQIEPKPMDAASFKNLMESSILKLGQETRKKVLLPEQFAFGFAPYFTEGAYPRPEHVDRLFVQLRAIEGLTRIIVDAQVTSLLDIARDEFDQRAPEPDVDEVVARQGRSRSTRGVPAAAARGAALPAREPDLYTSERLGVRFQGSEESVMKVLDTLSRCPLFMVLREVKLTNERFATSRAFTLPDRAGGLGGAGSMGPPGTAGLAAGANRHDEFSMLYEGMIPGGERPDLRGEGAAAQTDDVIPATPSHDERLVAGRELVTAEILLEMFRFKPAETRETDS